MISELIVVSLATAIGWEIFRYFLPLTIPVRVAPLIVTAIAFAFTCYWHPNIVLAFAAAGGVAVFHMITGDDSLPNLTLRKPDWFEVRLHQREFKRKIDNLYPERDTKRLPGL